MLAPDAIYERPIPERHRVIFYLGHLEAFDWNMICATSFGLQPFNTKFDRLFAFGIDPVDGGLPQDRPSDWPPVQEILSYNERVRRTVDDILDRANLDDATEPYAADGQIFRVAIEHRLMHAETLTYMLHWLDFDMKRSPSSQTHPPAQRPRLSSDPVRIPDGYATLGQDRRRESFGWDNEFQASSVFVPGFSMDVFNVTNGDYLEFVRQGGYRH